MKLFSFFFDNDSNVDVLSRLIMSVSGRQPLHTNTTVLTSVLIMCKDDDGIFFEIFDKSCQEYFRIPFKFLDENNTIIGLDLEKYKILRGTIINCSSYIEHYDKAFLGVSNWTGCVCSLIADEIDLKSSIESYSSNFKIENKNFMIPKLNMFGNYNENIEFNGRSFFKSFRLTDDRDIFKAYACFFTNLGRYLLVSFIKYTPHSVGLHRGEYKVLAFKYYDGIEYHMNLLKNIPVLQDFFFSANDLKFIDLGNNNEIS